MDHYGRSALNCFAANPIDRLTVKRRDETWLAEQMEDSETLFVPVWDSKQLFTDEPVPNPVLLSRPGAGELLKVAETIIFLGKDETRTYFALDLPRDNSTFADHLAGDGRFQDLKRFGAMLTARQAGLLAYARALTHWHRRHRFCSDCGSPTESVDGGHRRLCTNDRCGEQHFPRTDPAIITLVHSDGRCLLGRQAIWPQGFFSAIAGFVEPGESLEDAVVREIHEETGIRVTEVQYHSSQPWPFPGSIMLGFTAVTRDEKIHLVDHELEDARWFSRKDYRESLAAGLLRLPSSVSIAFRLIEDWYNADASIPLKTFLDSLGDRQLFFAGRPSS
jgi:NAD+ diphosphatase